MHVLLSSCCNEIYNGDVVTSMNDTQIIDFDRFLVLKTYSNVLQISRIDLGGKRESPYPNHTFHGIFSTKLRSMKQNFLN